ncbi:DUF4390 domain-containing protein [Xanthomonadaceae bacterium JHOS43]|nr:DUF4390 domain-containing protein [Xanthomonadaceae bacterium JHOS43]MCX7564487.1 DUF4390 domain-containing protein [Xanthomonadaceae bacterium XH05]
MLTALAACTDPPERAHIIAARTLPGVDGLHLELTQQIELSGAMRDALDHGIPLRLLYRIDACHQPRQRALWLRHAPLNRQYEMQREGDSEVRGFARLPALVAALDRIRLPLDLPADARCDGSVAVQIDLAALPTPLRFPAFFDPGEWQLVSAPFTWTAP